MRPSALNIRILAAALAFAIACLPLPCLPAQTSVSPLTGSPATTKTPSYAEESIVIERAESIYTYAADGTGTQERTVAARVQSDAAVRALGVVSVAYASASQSVEFLYARVRHPDGSVVETVTTDAIDMPEPVTREAPFYSDLKEKQLPMRSLRVGDTLEWKARITTTKAQAPGQIWGQESFIDDSVVLNEVVELRVPQALTVHVWSPTAKPVESTDGGLHVYRWTSSQLKPTVGKAAEAAAQAKKKMVLTPKQETDADQGKLPTIAWTSFESWQAVGDWYRSLEADRVTPSPEIKAKVAELTAGKTTDDEKIRAIYAYVATQIRYIGVAFGIGRYQPHTAAEILANQYGDCKDKHTLLAAMLSAAGIQSDAVLIGAGVRFNPDVPSPAAFNHLITYLPKDPLPGSSGSAAWLDTTAEIAPYRMLMSMIRDKQALVVPSSAGTEPFLARTPKDPPFASFQTMTAAGSLDKEGTSRSRLTLVERGDVEIALRAAFHQTPPAQYNELVQEIVRNLGYAGTSSRPEVSRAEDTTEPFQMSFDYERVKAGDWANYRIIPQVAPIGLPRFGDTDPLVRSLELGTPQVQTSRSEMKIPDGWTAILPEAVHSKCAYVTYDETYRFEKGTVYAERRIEILQEKVPAADLKTYKKWADDADLGNEMYIQLVRHDADANSKSFTVAPAAASPSSAGAPSAQVEKLIGEAFADIDKVDLYNAKELLDQAQKLSPNHEYLWSGYGALHYRNGEMAGALADLKKELTLHPAAYQRVYPGMIQIQLLLGQRKEAMDSLRAWSKADPVDPGPVAQLLGMLIADNDAKTAVAEGEAAMTRLPADGKNEFVRISLGQAYIMSGKKAQGASMLRGVLQDTQDAGTLNDAAYILADASLELPLADSSTRAALEKLDQESAAWTLDEDPQTLRAKTNLIVATWDTLGWLLFREGKTEEALKYLQAAWINMPSLDTGRHVGEVLVSRGDKAGALAIYQMAIATEPGYNALGVRTEPSEKQRQVQVLADSLDGGKAKPGKPAQDSLLELRTIVLGPANGRNGNAEYRLLIKEGRIVRSVPSGDKTVSGAAETISLGNFAGLFPAGSHAALVRSGFVNCHGKACEMVLVP